MVKKILIMATILVSILLTSCFHNELVGSWTNNEGDTVVFYSNGKLTMGEFNGTYEINDNVMIIKSIDRDESTKVTFSIDGNVLTLKSSNDDIELFYKE